MSLTPSPTPAPTPVPPPVSMCNTPAQLATLRQLTISNFVKAARKNIAGGSTIVQTVTITNEKGSPSATPLFLEMDVDSDLTLLVAKVDGRSSRSVTTFQDPTTNFVTSTPFTLAEGASITFKLVFKVASCPNSGVLYLPANVGIADGGPQCYVSGTIVYVSPVGILNPSFLYRWLFPCVLGHFSSPSSFPHLNLLHVQVNVVGGTCRATF